MKQHQNMPQPPPTGHPADELWQKIEQFQLDDPNALFPFSRKLAKENNWDAAFTQEAIKEYKRFVYLCCISPIGASPPEIVDQVWHLHLCYTVNYWENFCEKVLQQKLHHHPSSGGAGEHQRHREWWQYTLNFYRQIFHEDPPAHIWNPSPRSSSQNKPALIRQFFKKYTALSFFILSVLLLPLSGCTTANFIVLPLVIMFFIGIQAISRAINGKTEDPQKKDTSDGGSSGSSCSSSCGSSCSSECGGGGCGGCGGS